MEQEAQEVEIITNDPTIVYPVDFLQKEFCEQFETMSVTDFNTCVNYATLEIGLNYLSLILGLLLGFIIAKAVADGWN